jgi:hypothetical protein
LLADRGNTACMSVLSARLKRMNPQCARGLVFRVQYRPHLNPQVRAYDRRVFWCPCPYPCPYAIVASRVRVARDA